MFTKLTQFFKILRDTRLTDAERDAFRADFISYMRAHPYEKRREENPFIILAYFLFKKPVAITLCLVLVVLGSAGVAYASGGALPGDALYPIKINITEEIKAAFLPKEEKARFEVKRTARRIEEATELARKGRLTPKSAQIVQAQIEQHTETISELTEEIKAEGDAKIAADIHTELQATLAANELAFSSTIGKEDAATPEAQRIVAAIETAEDASKTETVKAVIALVQNDEIGEEELQKIAEEISMDVDQETTAVQQVAETTPLESPIAQKFAAAQTIKQEGERRLSEGAVKESVALFQEAKTRVKEVGKIAETSSAPQVSEPPPVNAQRPAAVSSEEPEKRTPIIETPLPRVNTAPKIINYPSVQNGAPQNEIHFIWEAFDPENDTLQWEVWWGDMERRENQEVCETAICSRISASHTWDSPGSYTVRVRVSDGKGKSDGYSFTVTIPSAEAEKEPETSPIRERRRIR